jgi:hypothetical protein
MHLQAPRPITHWLRMLSAAAGAAVVIAMGALTVVASNEAKGPDIRFESIPIATATTKGAALPAPQIPSAVPKHVQSWKCWDIFTSQC